MTLLTRQLVLIRRTEVRPQEGEQPLVRAGTGYLVDGRTVLTAAHCVAGAAPGTADDATPGRTDAVLEIRRPGRDAHWTPVTVAARHRHLDLAVLRLSDGPGAEEEADSQGRGAGFDGVGTPLLGIPDGDGAAGITSVELAGFPRAQRQADSTRLPEWVPGDLLPPIADPSLLSINVRSALPRRLEQHSPWAGMSGSPVLAEGTYLVGVVTQDNANFDGRLQAVALHSALETDPDFAARLPAEWRHTPATGLAELARYRIDDRLAIQISSPTSPLSPLVEERLPHSLAELTSARHALVPFIDRAELAQLRTEFLDTPDRLRVALVHGPAGCGKSRLADELHLVARADGWRAGLVTVSQAAHARRLQITRPLLLIFDYAESRVPQIKRLLTSLTRLRPEPLNRIRILLLARSAEGPWMNRLRSHVQLGRSLPDLTVDLAHRPLDAETRRRHYAAAAGTFAVRLGVPLPESEPDLEDEAFGLPLLVHIRALLDLRSPAEEPHPPPATCPPGAPPAAPPTFAERLLQGLLDREWERYWQHRFRTIEPGLEEEDAGELVALASLAGAADRHEAAMLLSGSEALAEASEETCERAAQVLHKLYAGVDEEYLSPVQPDLLGEFLIGRYLLAPERLSRVFRHCSAPHQRVRSIQVLRRMTTSPVLSSSGRSHEALRRLLELHLSTLVDEAVALATRRTDGDRAATAPGPHGSLARTLAEALAAAPVPEAAAELLRRPDPVFPVGWPELTDLAITLHEQAKEHLDSAGETVRKARVIRALLEHRGVRNPHEVHAVEQGAALSTTRLVADGQPPVPLLSGASAQARAVLRVGRVAEARTLAQEAVDLLRTHADDGPEVREELAKALGVLALTLVNVRDLPKALDSADESVRILEELWEDEWPDGDLAVASALMSQAVLLGIAGRPEPLAGIERAVELLRARTDRSGGTDGLSELVGAECLLATMRTSHGDLEGGWQAALAARDRAADYMRHSSGELEHLRAAVETAVATVAWVREDLPTAVDAVRTATEIYEGLSTRYESMFTTPLLSVYLLAGPILLEDGRAAEAVDQLITAAEWAWELTQDNPSAYLPIQINAMLMLAALGKEEDAQEAAELARDAVKLARDLVADNPDGNSHYFAQTLFNAAGVLEDVDWQHADALLTEAIDACRSADPEFSSFGAPLALTLICGIVLLRLAHEAFEQVTELAEEGQRVGRRVMATWPDGARLVLALMQAASAAHAALGHEAEEVVADTLVVDFLRTLALDDPAYREDLAEALESLSRTLRKVGVREHEALFAEAVALRLGQARDRTLPPSAPGPSAPGGGAQPEGPEQHPAPAPPEDLSTLAEHAGRPNSVVIGGYGGTTVAAYPFRPVLVLGPQRSRKTTGVVIPTLLDWDGPALVTSVRTDVIASTMVHRAGLGRAQIFEPTGKLYEGPATCQWNPLPDSRDWSGAVQSAHWLTEVGSKPGGLRESDFWYNLAAQLLAPHLHAAAVSGGTMGDVYEWVKSRDVFVVDHYLDAGEPAGRLAWSGIQALEERTLSSIYGTLMTSLSVYESSAVRSARSSLFDIDQFFDGRSNTLYLCAPPDEQEVLAPLFVGLIRRVLHEAYERHAAGASHRLLILLDEAGNIAPLRNLDTLATTAAGTGIQLVTVFHDISQMIAKFNVHEARTIANNHSAFLVLSGNRDPETSALVNELLREDPLPPAPDSGLDGVDVGRPVLRRLRPGTALCFYEHLPPGIIRLRSSSHDEEFRSRAAPVEDDPDGRWRRRRPAGGPPASTPLQRLGPGPGATSCVR